MVNGKRSLMVGGLGGILLCAAVGAPAQESGNSVIGPPQLKDFSLEPRERLVTAPPPQPQPERQAEPAPAQPQPRAERPAPRPAQSSGDPRREAPTPTPALEPRTEPAPTQPAETIETPIFEPVVEPPAEAPPAPVAERNSGTSYWLYALPVAALALLGLVLFRRRRAVAGAPLADPVPAAAAPPPKPRPDPVPRPWLELTLKAERASFETNEAIVWFELEIANKGGSAARNLRIDVKMFNAGAEQDNEIGAFFRTAGRESTKLNLPQVDAGVVGVIQGTVRMPVEEMRAMKLDERLLFIPVVAVNGLYDWGEGRTGQTSKSYVVGRELQEQSDKMGAFRVDQGPRIWRTVGQRDHKLSRRV